MQHDAGPQPVERSRPVRAVAQADGVVIPVGVAEPQQQAPRRLESQRVDELLAQQAHRRRAEDDDALLVQPDDALIGPKVQELGQIVVLECGRSGRWRRCSTFHPDTMILFCRALVDQKAPIGAMCRPVARTGVCSVTS